MALDSMTLECFRHLSQQRYSKAREAAVAAMAADASKKNEREIGQIRQAFARMPNVLDPDSVPYQVRGMLRIEDVSETFIPERHVASPEEEALVSRIERMLEAQELLAGMRVPYRTAVLLEGPSGSGKSEFARRVGSKLGLPLATLDFAYVIDSLVGKTARNIAEALEYAEGQACVLFLDEVDCVAVSRAATSEAASKERQNVTITLMQLLDRLPAGCLLLAATNRADLIDEALLRRFSIRARFEPYRAAELAEMVRRLVATTGVEWDAESARTTEDWCAAREGSPASSALDAAAEALADAAIGGCPFRMAP